MAILYRRTLGNVLLLTVDSTPNGSVTAPLGSLAVLESTGEVYQNRGGTNWRPYAVSTGRTAGGVSDSYSLGTTALARRLGSIAHSSFDTLGVEGSSQTEHFNMHCVTFPVSSADLQVAGAIDLLSVDKTAVALDAIMVGKVQGTNSAQMFHWQCGWRREVGPATLSVLGPINVSHSAGAGLATLSEASNTTTGAMRIVVTNGTGFVIDWIASVRMVTQTTP